MSKELASQDFQIAQAYRNLTQSGRRNMRLEERYGVDALAAQIPFPYSAQFTDDYTARRNANPAMQEMLRVTANTPGIYKLRYITYHANSDTPDKPFVCHFDFKLPDGAVFMARTKTSEVIINPDKEKATEGYKLEIQADASPIVHVGNEYHINICRDTGCHGDEDCGYTHFTVKSPEKAHSLDPVTEFLHTQNLGVNIDELDEQSRAFLLRDIVKGYFSTYNDDTEKYKDDYTVFEPVKRLGIVTVSPMVARFSLRDEPTGFDLKPYDRYLDMHVPYDIAALGVTQLVGKTHKTFELIADYIQLHNLQAKYLVGSTYERLAVVAKRFGFNVFELPLNEEVRRHTEESFWKKHPRGQQGKDMGRILVAFQETNEFLERFAA